MSWFLNLSTRAKLFLSFGVLIVFLAIVAAVAYGSIRSIQESEKKLFETDFANAVDLVSLESEINRSRADTLTMLVLAKGNEQAELHRDIQKSSKETDEVMGRLLTRNQNDATTSRKLRELQSVRDEFKSVRDNQVIPAILDGKAEEAKKVQSVQNERFVRMRNIIQELAGDAEQTAKASVTHSTERAGQSILVFVILSALALLLSVVLVAFLNRIIASPLLELTQAAKRIAEGDLKGTKLAAGSNDEIGQLGGAFNQMVEGLRGLTGQSLGMTQTLTAAAAEIMASTQEQAAGTKEQAATVQEITTTMEEVGQSGAQISSKAKQVAAAAEATSTASTSGLQAVQETTRIMGGVREQIEEVAANIVALSEKTQAIGEIIATVNDIAERSNLLALNAAIEAASAGEQGSRFSVVANEMKNLADQAKESTVQVRTILSDVQKGINSSVMLTEEAVKRSETGKQQADLAEQIIRQLARTTLESIQAFEQIIGANGQQQIGFEQVAQGMKDIRQAAGQTATATSQLEKAVANLNALGQELQKAIGRYRL